MTDTLLSAERISKSFGPTPALRDTSVDIGAGEIVAIMGPSGSGKSTLLHCLAGIFAVDEGVVRYEGRSLADLNDTARTRLRRGAFGFMFQFGQLVPELTAVDNIALPLLLGGERTRAAYGRAGAWFERLGLDGLADRRTGELSGGEAQRVALGRALVCHPRVLFADEPTGSLDSLNGERVMDLLVDTARAEGSAVVLVTHDARVAAHADRVVTVHDGRVVDPSVVGAA